MRKQFLLCGLLLLCFTSTLWAQTPLASQFPPSVHAIDPVFANIEGNSITLNWNNGNGNHRIVVARANAPVAFQPENNIDYVENSSFGSGGDVSGNGEYVVYDGTGNTVTITNLNHSTIYHFAVFEYNFYATATRLYLTDPDNIDNVALIAQQPTVFPPTIGSTTAKTTQLSSASVEIDWTNGNGANRIVVLKQGSTVMGSPTVYTPYTATVSSVFGSGAAQLNAGEYVVYAGNGNTVTVTNLTIGPTYYYKIFEYNGTNAPVYSTGTAFSGTPVLLPLTWLSFTAKKEADEIYLEWTTAAEQSTKYFIIERSSNGRDFIAIGSVKAQGNSSVNKYSYTDTTANGNVYYRVKQIDQDEKYEYSKIIKAEAVAAKKVTLYPNPVIDKVYIDVEGKMNVKIYDIRGFLIRADQLIGPSYLCQLPFF